MEIEDKPEIWQKYFQKIFAEDQRPTVPNFETFNGPTIYFAEVRRAIE